MPNSNRSPDFAGRDLRKLPHPTLSLGREREPHYRSSKQSNGSLIQETGWHKYSKKSAPPLLYKAIDLFQ